MNAFLRSVAAMTILLFLFACGDNSGEALDPSKPLEGRELSEAEQLEGIWMGVTDGDYAAFEFMEDGKVLVTHIMAAKMGLDAGMMLNYSVLDGGRLSLVAPDGQSQTFKVQISGDFMELAGNMMLSETDSQRFRRLEEGETLQQEMAEQEKAKAAAHQQRLAKLSEFLSRKDLVIAPNIAGPTSPNPIAVEFVLGGNGKAWHDEQSPHLDDITVAVESDGPSDKPTVRVGYGQQVSPPPVQPSRTDAFAQLRQQRSNEFVFGVTGDMSDPTITTKVTYNNQPFEMTIKADAALRKEIIGRFDSAMERAKAVRQPLIDALKDYAVIEGNSGSHHPQQNSHERIFLQRDPESGDYSGQGTLQYVNQVQLTQNFPVSARITVINDVPMLFIDGFNRQYQLKLETASPGKLSGGWFQGGGGNGWQSNLEIVEALDTASHQQQNTEQRAALMALNDKTLFVGFVDVFEPRWGLTVPFIVLTVSPSGDGKFNAIAKYPQFNGTETLSGQIIETPAGVAMQLHSTSFEADRRLSINSEMIAQRLGKQLWSLRVKDPASAEVHLTGSDLSRGDFDLVPMNDAWKENQMQVVREVLANGANFRISAPENNVDDTILHLVSDTADQVSGEVKVNGRQLQVFPTQVWNGKLSAQDGVPRLMFTILSTPNSGSKPRSEAMLYAVGSKEDLRLLGYVGMIGGTVREEFELTRVAEGVASSP